MNRKFQFLMMALLLWGCTGKQAIQIDVWYGDHQQFGGLGLPQRWINILGNVTSENGIQDFSYRLNDTESRRLSLGSDLHRLANPGDFNIDLDVKGCKQGKNYIELTAIDSAGNRLAKDISFTVEKNHKWPLPYVIRWDEVKDIQEVIQVVDGHWTITEHGLHNQDIYYDRVVAFGDDSWENYEVSTTVTFHGFTPPAPGPPTYNVSHAAISSRWPGHAIDSLQPNRKWFPLGATSEFRLTAGLDSCRWRIFDGPKPNAVNFYVEEPVEAYRSIELGAVYGMRHRVETTGEKRTKYSVKFWPMDQNEPDEWDLTGIEEEENLASGSALLIAHNTSVTFGDVKVIPIENEH